MGSASGCIFPGICIKFLLTARGTKVVGLPLILAFEFRCFFIYSHLTDRVDCHRLQTPRIITFLAGGIYLFSRSESETTVTELAAMARAASSGLKV